MGSLSLLQRIFLPQNQTGVSCIAGGYFTSWATREACGFFYLAQCFQGARTLFHGWEPHFLSRQSNVYNRKKTEAIVNNISIITSYTIIYFHLQTFLLDDFFLSISQWHMDWVFLENQIDFKSIIEPKMLLSPKKIHYNQRGKNMSYVKKKSFKLTIHNTCLKSQTFIWHKAVLFLLAEHAKVIPLNSGHAFAQECW